MWLALGVFQGLWPWDAEKSAKSLGKTLKTQALTKTKG